MPRLRDETIAQGCCGTRSWLFSLFLSALGSRWLSQGVLRQVHEGYRTAMNSGLCCPVDAFQIEEQGCSSRLLGVLHNYLAVPCVLPILQLIYVT